MIRYNGKDIVPMYNGRELKRVLCRGHIIWERVYEEHDYTLKCSTMYPANPYKCTINGNTHTYTGGVEVDVGEFAPIITFKLASVEGISKLPYLGDCEELIIVGTNYQTTVSIPDSNTKKCKIIQIQYPYIIYGLDLDSVETLAINASESITRPVQYANLRNLGKSSLDTYNLQGIELWRHYRQTLVDSLITNSYDRAANGMPPATIRLYDSVFNELTDTEKAQITAKGFTLVRDY